MDVPVLAYGGRGRPRHARRGGRAVRREEPRTRWPSWPTASPPTTPCGRRSSPASAGASRPSPRRPWSRPSAATSSRCERPTARARDRGPALRRRRDRGLGVPGPGGGRAAGRRLRRHGLHDLRPRLRHLAERAARGEATRRTASRWPASRSRRSATSPRSTALGAALRRRAPPRRTSCSGCAARGPTCRASWRPSQRRKSDFEAVVFFTYLYYPTYWGLQGGPRAIVLVPTAHDEPPLALRHLPIGLRGARGPSPSARCPRRSWCERGFPSADRPVGGRRASASRSPAAPDVEGFQIRHDVRGPYAALRRPHRRGQGLRRDARLLRPLPRELPRSGRAAPDREAGHAGAARARGALPRATSRRTRRWRPWRGPRPVICPSPYESLSIVLLEGLALGTPALVNARSAGARGPRRRSNAGPSTTATPRSSSRRSTCSSREDGLRAALGENGARYVRENYRWDVVMERYRALIDAAAGRTLTLSESALQLLEERLGRRRALEDRGRAGDLVDRLVDRLGARRPSRSPRAPSGSACSRRSRRPRPARELQTSRTRFSRRQEVGAGRPRERRRRRGSPRRSGRCTGGGERVAASRRRIRPVAMRP